MKLNRGNYTAIFFIAELFTDILWWGSIQLQISNKNSDLMQRFLNTFFFFSWYFVVRSNMILSFITRLIWPEKGNNRTWIAFSINIEQELLNISFFYISIYDYRIYWKSVKHFICFLFCPFFKLLNAKQCESYMNNINRLKALGCVLNNSSYKQLYRNSIGPAYNIQYQSDPI